ncbi:unnamed protein product [Ranitomeya imitator]|uniref:DNA helicase n=1 Tax=Ranitomeya imitator TaxID=111125 RepID=A0ABN9LKD3_9NEOB|nr:unnamed protein product [Ranitomeya imitator]
MTSSSCLHAAAPAQAYFVCPVEGRAKYCSAQAPGYIGGLSTALQNAVDKPLMPTLGYVHISVVRRCVGDATHAKTLRFATHASFFAEIWTQEKCNLLRFLGPTLAAKKTHAKNKLNTLVQKLHEFLAHSSEESEDTTSPTRESGDRSAGKSKSIHRLNSMENMEEGSSSEKAKIAGTSRSKRTSESGTTVTTASITAGPLLHSGVVDGEVNSSSVATACIFSDCRNTFVALLPASVPATSFSEKNHHLALKPIFVTKYVGADEDPKPDAIVIDDVPNDHSDPEVDMESLPLGTVVVQPEPVLNEDKDDFKGPEFRIRTKVKPDLSLPKKRPGI